jgi:predicted dehydrogenase
MNPTPLTRRSFLKTSTLTGAALAFPFISVRNVLGANSRLNIVGVGVGGKGWVDITSVDGENIIGVCDVDTKRLLKARERFPSATAFGDWRVMFDKLGNQIDAVTVSTPDHTHFHPSYRAVTMGKHVFCQKPLTHTIWEARTLTEAARKAKVATQMGNQGISHPKLRRDAELIKTGVIGDVREIHIWTDRPGKWWKQGLKRPTEFPPVPSDLHWDLWLGGSARRPYHPQYSHFQWRGWWDYGTGAIGDMGCHLLNCATLALDVRDPVSVRGSGEGATEDTGPIVSQIEWQFPAHHGKPAWKLFWYDGGRTAPQELFPGKKFNDNGQILVGTKDTFYSPGYNGGGVFKSGATHEDFKNTVTETLPKPPVEKWDRCHYDEWIAACKGGPKAYSNFDTSGPVTEVVLLGTLALRAGAPLEWNAKKLKVTNVKFANQWVTKQYAKGWKV